MSATSGSRIFFFISFMAAASSRFLTATRTISQPACSRPFIWATTAFTSAVSVFAIDCIETGALPPTLMLPTLICLVFRLFIILSLKKGAEFFYHSEVHHIVIEHDDGE